MKAAVALTLSVSLLGCFPHSPRKRTYAKIAEGAALVTGIAVSAIAETGADCDERIMPGPNVEDSCHTKAKWLSNVGVTLILAGLLGFVVTISTAEDVEVQKHKQPQQLTAEEKQSLELPAGVAPQPQSQPQATPAAGEAPTSTDATDATPSDAADSAPEAPSTPEP